jgi:hypothetical protein
MKPRLRNAPEATPGSRTVERPGAGRGSRQEQQRTVNPPMVRARYNFLYASFKASRLQGLKADLRRPPMAAVLASAAIR